jgi:hypothetical protein
LGVDPQRIIVAGVPLELDDMKKLNPKIPEKALEPVKKKINRVKEDIERKKSVFNTESILVTVTGDLAGQILSERAEEFYNARKIQNANLKDIEINEFLKMLRNC